MTTKWIKIPKPGEFRGEGIWARLEDVNFPTNFKAAYWDWCKATKFLPTFEGDEPPKGKDK